MNEYVKFFTEQFLTLVSYIVWPIIVLIIVFTVRKPLFELLNRISKLKYGEFEADLAPITKELNEIIPLNKKKKQIIKDKSLKQNPNLAIINSWTEFEKLLKEVYIKLYPQRESNFLVREIINDLVRDSKLPPQFTYIVFKLSSIRNLVVHGAETYTLNEAEEYINNINTITNYINENLSKSKITGEKN